MKDKLLKLRKTKVYITGDHSSLICCPFCKADLQKTDKNYLCKMHGLFDIDSSNRPLLIEKKVLKKNTTEHESGINWLTISKTLLSCMAYCLSGDDACKWSTNGLRSDKKRWYHY